MQNQLRGKIASRERTRSQEPKAGLAQASVLVGIHCAFFE
ncbi:hypothetical protein BRCON_0779 [Candidatus Sumerlaea chitinivorans]|uniref:Uncharacterized protein n=1 Tax=Sumerlaea chitinivorans TaxID=2250252 RepID=A0A2Z4Y3P8_SUMC1|nr:hypothetical protein BRCON_0779 [Candidatus Sumerlaea chitinivorans]